MTVLARIASDFVALIPITAASECETTCQPKLLCFAGV
jgi:hypothetical protein